MIPKNPITVKVNGWITDNYLKAFLDKNLPAFDYKITSGYRSQAKNEELKKAGYNPAADSAHMYNLARDIVLYDKQGNILSDGQMKKVFEQFIFPFWEGYTYFNPKTSATKTGWIHLNLDRSISEKTAILGIAGLALAVGLSYKKIWEYLKKIN